MDVNPFAAADITATQDKQTSAVSDPQGEGSGNAAGLNRLLEVSQQYQRHANRVAATSWNSRALNSVIRFGHDLLRRLGEYARRALDLAMHKFIVELCAMVISAVFAALTKKGYGGMDISTKDVYFRSGNGPGPQATSTQSSQSSSSGKNPFESWTTPNTASAW